jgi:hypothetical protein
MVDVQHKSSQVEVQMRDKSIIIGDFNAQVASGDGILLKTKMK